MSSGFAYERTDRLALTMPTGQDLVDYHLLHSDPATYLHAPHARHPDLSHSQSVLADILQDWRTDGLGYWTIRDPGSHRYLGTAGVRRSGFTDRHGVRQLDGSWNVYYRFYPAVWGRGYAAEVIEHAARCVVQLDPDAQLQAVIRPANVASQRVAQRLGMSLSHTRIDPSGEPELVFQAAAAVSPRSSR